MAEHVVAVADSARVATLAHLACPVVEAVALIFTCFTDETARGVTEFQTTQAKVRPLSNQ
jgi:hypothetical protein